MAKMSRAPKWERPVSRSPEEMRDDMKARKAVSAFLRSRGGVGSVIRSRVEGGRVVSISFVLPGIELATEKPGIIDKIKKGFKHGKVDK